MPWWEYSLSVFTLEVAVFNKLSIFVPHGPRVMRWIKYPNEVLISKNIDCSIISATKEVRQAGCPSLGEGINQMEQYAAVRSNGLGVHVAMWMDPKTQD